MRRSFGGYGGGAGAGGGGSGGGGGGGMFRTISRVGRAGLSNLQDASSSSSSSSTGSSSRKASKRGLSLGSKATAVYPISVALSSSNLGLISPALLLRPCSSVSDDSDWVNIPDESSGESEIESFDDYLFGSAPSPVEAQTALLSVQHALPTLSHSESDWIEPPLYPYGFEQALCPGMGRVYDAFHLLQTEPSVQRMVISLSSDRAVWNAVLNNEAVRELREAFCRDEATALETPGDEPNPSSSPKNVLGWILNNMRAKFLDFLGGITNLMKELFQPPCDDSQEKAEFPEGFGELVRAAFMLTAIILLVVVVTRASHA